MPRTLLLSVALMLTLAACQRPEAPGGVSAARNGADRPAEASPAAPSTTRAPQAAAPSAGSGAMQLARFDGYGDMRFGMSVDEARDAWGGELAGAVGGNDCGYLHPVSNTTPADFAFMFEGARFVRYDVGNDKETAPGGGRRGMSEQRIRSLYGSRVEASPHKYVDGGKYLKVDGDGGALVFETDAGGTVTGWRAGVEPNVDYVEGCS